MEGRTRQWLFVGTFLALIGIVQAVDVSITLGDSGFSGYVLNSFSPPEAAVGTIGTLNPDLKLVYRKRYEITVVNFVAHPLDILAKATSAASDVVLLSMARELRVRWKATARFSGKIPVPAPSGLP